jgi:hypothetical protein
MNKKRYGRKWKTDGTYSELNKCSPMGRIPKQNKKKKHFKEEALK